MSVICMLVHFFAKKSKQFTFIKLNIVLSNEPKYSFVININFNSIYHFRVRGVE